MAIRKTGRFSASPKAAAIAVSIAVSGTVLSFGALAVAEASGKPSVAKREGNPEFTSAIARGDEAYLAQRFDEAAAQYAQAVEKQRQNPVGYARLAAAQRQLGKFDDAIATLGKGLETSSTVTERAKLLFLQADIREQQRLFDKARERWTAYLDLTGAGERTIDLDAPDNTADAAPTIKGEHVYPATAEERLKQIEAAEKRVKDYAPVRQRIKKREDEVDAKARGK